jgi:hypothetical protein
MKQKSTWLKGMEDSDLHRLLSERAARHQSGSSTFTATNRGDEAFVLLRPICTGNDCPDQPLPPGDHPCGGQPFTWQPDLAARLNLAIQDCPTQASLTLLEQVVASNLSRFKLPDPEVRATCNDRIIDILIWGTRVTPGSCGDLSRKRAKVEHDIADGGTSGFYLSTGLIRQLAQDAFDAAPKRLYSNGFAGADGPIHLSSLSVDFEKPDVVKTIITGYDDRPWPDVGFTTTITDRLGEQRDSTTTIDTVPSRDDEIVALLAALVTTAVAVFIPVLMPLPALVIWTDLNDRDRPDNPPDGGVGARVIEALPDQIPLPETGGIATTNTPGLARRVDSGDVTPQPEKQKLVIQYNKPRVDPRGILVSAFCLSDARIPKVSVIGPNGLSLDLNASSTSGYFAAHREDFYGPLKFVWTTAHSDVVMSSPTASATKITFQRGNAEPGDNFDRTVTVSVTDVEGSSATASLLVTVFAAEPGDDLPAVCKVKPWLKECTPGR